MKDWYHAYGLDTNISWRSSEIRARRRGRPTIPQLLGEPRSRDSLSSQDRVEAPGARASEETPGARECAGSIGWLLDVAVLWLWVVYPIPFFGSLRRDDVRGVDNRINLAMVAHEPRVGATFDETLARLVDGLFTFLVIGSHATRLHQKERDAGMMVPATRASGFDDLLCPVCTDCFPLSHGASFYCNLLVL